jgi:hypothetical protein
VGAGDDGVVAAARAGDESAFAALVERHQRELRVHSPMTFPAIRRLNGFSRNRS